jgi:hypothetical protein
MWASFALGKCPLLVFFGQSNVAPAVPMDVHKHGRPNKEGIFVDARVRPFRYTSQGENLLSQFLVKFYSRFHTTPFVSLFRNSVVRIHSCFERRSD